MTTQNPARRSARRPQAPRGECHDCSKMRPGSPTASNARTMLNTAHAPAEGQQSSRCATSSPERVRSERRLSAPCIRADFRPGRCRSSSSACTLSSVNGTSAVDLSSVMPDRVSRLRVCQHRSGVRSPTIEEQQKGVPRDPSRGSAHSPKRTSRPDTSRDSRQPRIVFTIVLIADPHELTRRCLCTTQATKCSQLIMLKDHHPEGSERLTFRNCELV
jgi:hypothetical protein